MTTVWQRKLDGMKCLDVRFLDSDPTLFTKKLVFLWSPLKLSLFSFATLYCQSPQPRKLWQFCCGSPYPALSETFFTAASIFFKLKQLYSSLLLLTSRSSFNSEWLREKLSVHYFSYVLTIRSRCNSRILAWSSICAPVVCQSYVPQWELHSLSVVCNWHAEWDKNVQFLTIRQALLRYSFLVEIRDCVPE